MSQHVKAPSITQLIPDFGPGGQQVTIDGTDLTGANPMVNFGTDTFPPASVTPFTFDVPSGATAGGVNVSVTVSGLTSNPLVFTVT